MRILAVRGENLASLARQFDVDLAGGPLASAGVFAIVGPTGAGKSTLLDAICVALFDRTPRLGGRSSVLIGRGDDLVKLGMHDVRGLLRRGASSGFAEVDFEGVDGRRYRSRWDVWRARAGRARATETAGGRLQDQRLTLTCIETGERIGGTRTETLDAIRARLGLKFEQFCRSALLAQGEFAAFLRADAADRADLLERMTGTEIYGELSIRAHLRAKEVEAALDVMRARAAAIPTLTDDERGGLIECLAAAEAQLAIARARLARLSAASTWVGQRDRLAAAIADAEAAVAAADREWTASAGMRDDLARAARVDAIRPQWDDHARSAAVLERARVDAARVVRERGEAHDRHAVAAVRVAALEPVLAAARDARATAGVAIADATGDARVRRDSVAGAARDVVVDIDAARSAIASSTAWLDAHRAIAAAAAAWSQIAPMIERERAAWHDADALDRRAPTIAAELAHAESTRDRAIVDERAARDTATIAEGEAAKFEEARRKLPVDVARRNHLAAENQLQAATVLEAVVARARAAAASANDARTRRSVTVAEEAARRESRARHDASAADDRARLGEAARVLDRLVAAAGLDHHRADLIDGEPCPLCGATAHPWADGGAIDDLIAGQRERVVALRSSIDAATAAAADDAAAIAVARADLKRFDVSIADAAAKLAAAVPEFKDALSVAGELPWVSDPASDEARRLADDHVAQARAAHERARLARDNAEAADRAANDARTVVLSRHADVERAGIEARAAIAIVDDRRAALAAIERERAALAAAAGDRRAQWDQLGLGRALDDRGVLDELARDVERWHDEARAVHRVERELAGAMAGLAAVVHDASHRLAAADAAAGAAADAVARAEAEHAAATAARDRALDAAGLTIDDAAAVLARPPGWADVTRTELDALAARRARARAIVDERTEHLADHERRVPALAAGDLDPAGGEVARPAIDLGDGSEVADASVRRALAVVAASLADDAGDSATAASFASARDAADATQTAARRVDALQREVTVVAERLRADDDARVRRGAAEAELAAAEAAAETDRVLADLIGSHDGKAFRTFAQSLTLDALLIVANDHLSQLQPRYQLERVPGHDLELQAVDRDLGDEVRSVASLSGGESFLVSLALALALSSVSARNVRVGTLLIDEGFGTLDPSALDTALAVLDALQATGCQVGLISHVPGLIERVGAHVVVRPLGGGRSAVEIRAA